MHPSHRRALTLSLTAAACAAAVLVAPAAVWARTEAAAPAAATGYPVAVAAGRAAAGEALRTSGASSLSIALVDGERVVWAEGFGYADLETRTPPSPITMFGVGSVSKMFAAVATMQLVDRGLVDLDTPVYRYISRFRMASPEYRQVTVRMLLDHSSGFPGSEYRNASVSRFVTGYPDQLLDCLAEQRLKTTPGYMSVYCNDGFSLVEALVKDVTGDDYETWVTREILRPLEMTHTRYPTTAFPDGAYAQRYIDGRAQPRETLELLASGAAYSTPSDMGHLASMFMNGGVYRGRRVLSAASVRAMGVDETVGQYNPVYSAPFRYGLGWDTVADGGWRTAGYTGWTKAGDAGDYHCSFTVSPGARLACVVNGVTPLSSTALNSLAQKVLMTALQERGSIRKVPRAVEPPAVPLADATPEGLAAIAGFYGQHQNIFQVTVSSSRSRALTVSSWNGIEWTVRYRGLRLRTDGVYRADGQQVGVRVKRTGDRIHLIFNQPWTYGHYRIDMLAAEKLDSLAYRLSDAWTARLGGMWVSASEASVSMAWSGVAAPVMTVVEAPDRPGALVALIPIYGGKVLDAGARDDLAAAFLQVPGMGSRDDYDLRVEHRVDGEWMHWGDNVFRPVSSIPTLAAGDNAVLFGAEGYCEWRAVETTAVVRVRGVTDWRLYDPGLARIGAGGSQDQTITVPGGGCALVLFGAPGSGAGVRVTPQP